MKLTTNFQVVVDVSDDYTKNTWTDEKTDIKFQYEVCNIPDFTLIENYIIHHYKNIQRMKDTRFFKAGLVPLLWVPSFMNSLNVKVVDLLQEELSGLDLINLPMMNLFSTKEINYSKTYSYEKQTDIWVFREDICKRLGIAESKYTSLEILKLLSVKGEI